MKLFCCIILMAVYSYSGISQGTVTNTDKPLSGKANRVVMIKETLSIPETGKDYYLENPGGLDVSPDGNLFVLDRAKVLEFDSAGNYIRQFKPSAENILLTNLQANLDRLYVFDRISLTLFVYDRTGFLKNSFQITDRSSSFLFAKDQRVYFMGASLYSLDEQGKDKKDLENLSVTIKDLSEGSVIKTVQTVPLTDLDDDHFAYLSHTPEYLVKKIDLNTGKLVGSFTRTYPRVPYVSGQAGMPAYKNDIARVVCKGDDICAFTYTFDEKKGVLTDVFNAGGEFLDSYYLCYESGRKAVRFSPLLLNFSGNSIYVLIRGASQGMKIVKGTLVDKS